MVVNRLPEGMNLQRARIYTKQSEEVLLWKSLRPRKMWTPPLELEDKQFPLEDAAGEVLFSGMGSHVPRDYSQMTTALGLDILIGQQV